MVDDVDEELVGRMKDSSCQGFSIRFESANHDTLKFLKKGIIAVQPIMQFISVLFYQREIFSEYKQEVFYRFLIQFTEHNKLDCCSLISSTNLEDVIQKFNLAKRYNGNFCLATHYWEIELDMLQ